MPEPVRAEKELSGWLREQSEFFLRTAKMTAHEKSCFGTILEERTVLFEVETLFLLSCL